MNGMSSIYKAYWKSYEIYVNIWFGITISSLNTEVDI